jgi:photosystem II stability/assembly factor-like uncharacterized protein
MKALPILFLFCFSLSHHTHVAQSNKKPVPAPSAPAPELATYFEGLKFRNIGPARGGRSTAVAGIRSMPHTFFMGATGGGVWRTDDGGTTWNNVTDGFISVGSIGSIRVAPSDPNVIYVGTGSADPRGNVSIGKGIYRSTDQGKTWSLSGLEKGGQIGRIEIHPTNPDIAFAAVLGNPFGPNAERGMYRTKDGGKNWDRVLFVNDKTGAIDLVMDPNNPRILFAGMWQVQRKPWTLVDGGPDGGVYQSIDGGDTWKKVENGLPTGVTGKVGIAISPANSNRIWVLIETPDDAKGGLYRSNDGGKSFNRINGDRELRTRHWYYTRIFADPKDAETVYVNNVSFWKSTDGGNNFSSIRVLHGDCHDLWINPDNTDIMIHSNDGGAHVSYNGGKSWSTLFNQPTAELYRVAVDNAFPYRVYACQQDNSSISVSSAVRGGSSYLMDWLHVGGGEAGHVAVNPENSNIIYAGEYTGIITRYDRSAEHMQYVTHYPQMHDGLPLYKVKYRYQWNAPIRVSPHNANTVYHCSQFVHRSLDGGINWEVISPDLTSNKKEYQEIPGGPVQHDYTGVENYTTVFAFEESPLEAGVLMAGTDDGFVHLSRDNGKTWANVTPTGLPSLATVNTIDFSRHKKGKIYVTAHNYRLNDFKPYVFKTEDYGKTWSLITTGIPSDFTTRVMREDPNREGLLYAGTEFGLFLSMNDGKTWSAFQLNLPRVPITDLLIKNKDLVMSTQGRSFWILDDLSPLYQWKDGIQNETAQLFAPRTSYRTQLGGFWGAAAPTASPDGTIINFYLHNAPDTASTVRLEFLNAKGELLRTYSTKPDKEKRESELKVSKGLNRFLWDYYCTAPSITPGSFFSMASLSGPKAPTGTYTTRLTVGTVTQAQTFQIAKDPRWKCTDEDLMASYELTKKAVEELDRMHKTIRTLRSIRDQSNQLVERAEKAGKAENLKKLKTDMNKKLSDLEELLIQTKHKAGQDPINYPPKFDDQIAWLVDVVNGQDARPTQGCYDLYNDLKKEADGYVKQLENIIQTDLKAFNEQVLKENVGGVMIEGIK